MGIPKNFFKIRYGQYEFLVMSFGFTNAPPIFLDFINYVFRPYLDSLVVVFIDKILFCSGCRKQHRRNVIFTLNDSWLYAIFTK